MLVSLVGVQTTGRATRVTAMGVVTISTSSSLWVESREGAKVMQGGGALVVVEGARMDSPPTFYLFAVASFFFI